MKNEFDCKKQQTQSVLTRCCAGLLIGFCVWGTSSYPLPVYASDAVVSIEEQQQQAVRITGKVTDENGEPVIGASVVVKGTSTGTVTNLEGNYSITVAKGQTLEFSFIGMKPIAVKIADKKVVNITLQDNAVALDEVVAIGYASMKRSDLTGAVTSVSSEMISQMNPTSIDQVLQGRAAGVLMIQNNGMPGGGASVQIRGLNSINGTNEPIYIIDGVTISGNTGTDTDNALSSINPSDIESMEVLKDASATAIYGANGANGVIIITTKRGREGKPRVNLEAQYGIQYLAKQLDMANLREYAQHNNEVVEMMGRSKTAEFANPSLLGEGTNWQTAIFRPASMQNYNLNMSGGVKGTSYKVGAGYLRQDGIAEGSDFDRITLSAAIDSEVNKWLKIGGSANLSRTTQTTSIADWNIINSAVKQKPNVPVYNLDGSYGSPSESDDNSSPVNALAIAQLVDKNNRKLSVRSNLYATVTPFKWMNFKTEFSSNVGTEEVHSFTPSYYFTSWQKNDYADRQESIRVNYYWAWRNLLNFNLKPGKNQNLTLMLGHEMTETRSNYLKGSRRLGSNSLTDLGAGDASTAENDGYTGRSSFLSFFGRAHHSLLDRYMLTATMRYDGSSNFARGNRWGAFPSAALAWRINKENFLKEVEWLSNLKLRAGYGVVGNSNVASFAYTSILNNTETIWGSGQALSRLPNEGLTWETTKSFNIGLDLSFFNNRVEFIADWYNKRTDDLLIVLTLPGITGTNGTGAMSAPWGNVGSLRNRGFEFTLNTVNVSRKEFQWRSSLVFSLNRNKVLDLNTATAQVFKTYQFGGNDKQVTLTQPGYAIGQFYGYKVIGRINSAADLFDESGKLKVALPEEGATGQPKKIDEKNGIWVGDLLFEDVNKDGLINAKDQQVIGNPLPKFTGGFGNTFSYKGFDLNLYFTFCYGNDVMNWLNMTINNPRDYTNNLLKDAALHYAKYGVIDPEGSANNIYNVRVISGKKNISRISSNDLNENNRVSSNLIEDGSYIRLQTVNLSYTFPRKLTSKLGLEMLKLYCNVSNLFTISGYSGYDPEVGMARDQYSNYAQSALLNGFDAGRYPSPRTFTFGINIGF